MFLFVVFYVCMLFYIFANCCFLCLSLFLSGPEKSRGVESTGRQCAARGETPVSNSGCLGYNEFVVNCAVSILNVKTIIHKYTRFSTFVTI